MQEIGMTDEQLDEAIAEWAIKPLDDLHFIRAGSWLGMLRGQKAAREEIARLKAELETAQQRLDVWYPSTGWAGAAKGVLIPGPQSLTDDDIKRFADQGVEWDADRQTWRKRRD